MSTEESCLALAYLYCKEKVSAWSCTKDDLGGRSRAGTLASPAAPGAQALPSWADAWNSLPASHPEQLRAVTRVVFFSKLSNLSERTTSF